MLSSLAVVCAAALGLVIGSFLNVVILRLSKAQSLGGRSACVHCGHRLAALDLLPVVSFMLLRGRCRYCRAPISAQYPLVELATALSFGIIASVHAPLSATGPTLLFILYAAGAALSIAIAGIDYYTTIVPDKLAYPLALIALISVFITENGAILPAPADLLSGIGVAAPLAALWLVSRGRWIGLGDAKYALSIGWFLGWSGGMTAVMVSFWIGAVASLGILAIQKARARVNTLALSGKGTGLTMKSEIPFAPFLIGATALVAVTGFDLVEFVL